MSWKNLQSIKLFAEQRYAQSGSGPKFKNSRVEIAEDLKKGDIVQFAVWAPKNQGDSPGISISKFIKDPDNGERFEPERKPQQSASTQPTASFDDTFGETPTESDPNWV